VWGRTGGGSHGAHGEPPLGAAQGLVRAVAGWSIGGAVSGRIAGRLREVRRRGRRPGGAREEAGRRLASRDREEGARGRRPGGAREEVGSRVDWRGAGVEMRQGAGWTGGMRGSRGGAGGLAAPERRLGAGI